MTPLDLFKRELRKMTPEKIERVKASFKESVGGGTKTRMENAVVLDMRAAVEEEERRRKANAKGMLQGHVAENSR